MSAVAPITDHYVNAFTTLKSRLPGAGVPWLEGLRSEALARFQTLGFPSTRDEDWKYTSVRPIERRAFALVGESCLGLMEEDLGEALMEGLETHRMVFVNGAYAPQLSHPGRLPTGVRLASMAAITAADPQALEPFLGRYAASGTNGFSALNASYWGDGVYLDLAPGVELAAPIHLVYVTTAQSEPMAHHLRNLIIAGEASCATVIEHYIRLGDGVYLNNVVTEAVLGARARLVHYRLQEESEKAYHVSTLQAHQERDSRLTAWGVSLGGALVRHDTNSVLDGEGAHCSLLGLYVAAGRQHVDNHTRIDHKRPHGTSREIYKGVLGGRARAVFSGKIHVHPHAQKTDAEQSNKNLLLSRDAEVDTKPQLEIYADDVKCAHGATVGQLDEQMLFYLRSRGIDEASARGMLTYGFARDLVERMDLAAIRERTERLVADKLRGGAHLELGL
jgi:Fe-S cluster assembly protein SufD